MNNFEGSKAIVYYCGHGIPDEKTGDAYIVPVDGKGTNTATCYRLNKLYTTLAATKAANSDGSHQPESRNFVEDNEA